MRLSHAVLCRIGRGCPVLWRFGTRRLRARGCFRGISMLSLGYIREAAANRVFLLDSLLTSLNKNHR